ncbi:amidase [Perspicuibacillus lycopersici]
MNIEPNWLIEATIDEVQEKLESEEITSKQLVMMYLHRIAKLDKQGPNINSILEVNPDALSIAAALDYERKTKGARGPLHGIPVVIKDNIDTGDNMHTSAGSLVLANSYAKEDAFLVKKLREAGAVILGKANLTEWANFIGENMPSGYSSRGGQVKNPYGDAFDIGGSSSGSAAAVATNLAVVAVGTETSGSILSPASQASLVGIKPTVGLISRNGIIPISHTQDTAGPMARTVRDAAILLNVLQGQDTEDAITGTNPLESIDFTNCLKREGLKGKRIGIARTPYYDYLSQSKLAVMENAIAELKQLGAEVIDPVEIPSTKEQWDMNVLIYEFKNDLNAYLKTVDSSLGIRTLADVIRKNEELGETALKYGQKLFLEAEAASGNLTDPTYLESLVKDAYYSREMGIDAVLKNFQLDAVLFPNNYGAMMPAKAGYPSITVPAGYTEEGEPVGITFTASAYSEPLLIELAYSYEQGTKHRIPPVFADN